MARILIFKRNTQNMKPESFLRMAETLKVKGKPMETDNAIAVRDAERALVYAQPCAKFAGLLFYTDQSRGLADSSENLLDSERAKRWANAFLKEFNLVPSKVDDKRVNLQVNLSSTQTEAVVFDGKERKLIKNKTEIRSDIKLNEIPVVGPRAKVRMVFKEDEKPILIHRGLWDAIEVYEEKELLRINDVAKAVKEKLVAREGCSQARYDVISTRLAYFADEYAGGIDILAPYYFIEMEFEDKKAKENGITQGPRQLFWLPAYR
jgi:regulatory protein YycI of two-component signal transduction system YycFG